MKKIFTIAVLAAAAFLAFSLEAYAQKESTDAFTPISKYISKGDAESLSAWFSDNLEISIFDRTSICGRSQARQILKSFFASHSVRSFEVTHTASRGRMKYALGTMNAGGETFLVTLFIAQKGSSYEIQQFKISRSEI